MAYKPIVEPAWLADAPPGKEMMPLGPTRESAMSFVDAERQAQAWFYIATGDPVIFDDRAVSASPAVALARELALAEY